MPPQVALTFGFAITTLCYTIGHYSGGHVNPAVTFGLVIAGKCSILQGLANFVAQLLGAFCGAGIIAVTFDHEKDMTGNLGSNVLAPGVNWGSAFMGESFMTGLLMLVVLETACNPRAASTRVIAPLTIGLMVFIAHSVLMPIDGCSINPARSIGPAIWASMLKREGPGIQPDFDKIWRDHWIFWVAPLVGAGVVAGVNRLMANITSKEAKPKVDHNVV